jgi:hypothetical protein
MNLLVWLSPSVETRARGFSDARSLKCTPLCTNPTTVVSLHQYRELRRIPCLRTRDALSSFTLPIRGLTGYHVRATGQCGLQGNTHLVSTLSNVVISARTTSMLERVTTNTVDAKNGTTTVNVDTVSARKVELEPTCRSGQSLVQQPCSTAEARAAPDAAERSDSAEVPAPHGSY